MLCFVAVILDNTYLSLLYVVAILTNFNGNLAIPSPYSLSVMVFFFLEKRELVDPVCRIYFVIIRLSIKDVFFFNKSSYHYFWET